MKISAICKKIIAQVEEYGIDLDVDGYCLATRLYVDGNRAEAIARNPALQEPRFTDKGISISINGITDLRNADILLDKYRKVFSPYLKK